MATTLKQELELIAQDQANASEAFKKLCKARMRLHRAAKNHKIALDWVSYGHTVPSWLTHSRVAKAGAAYIAAKSAWLEAA